ncbi:MAG: hypothetical protein H6740_08495 [Alphaproteobacteria bacterium]|nr:hypothetical protein [Alphaproteobacteria bacterium]
MPPGGHTLILSQARDPVAPEVMDWLAAWGEPVVRVNAEDPVLAVDLRLGAALTATLRHASGLTWRLEQTRHFWHQRGALRWAHPAEGLPPGLAVALDAEWRALAGFLLAALARGPSLGATPADPQNKLWQLLLARDCGLRVPETRVLSERAALEALLAGGGEWLTKAIQDLPVIPLDGAPYAVRGAQALSAAALSGLGPRFFPGLFQRCVPKEHDVRALWLDGALHAVAVLPPAGQAAALDYRVAAAPPRCAPMRLPEPVVEGVRALTEALGVDYGVLDLVARPDGELVFLELNLSGQFEYFAAACNLPFARDLAARVAGRGRP